MPPQEQPDLVFASTGHGAGALLEDRSARVAEIGGVLPQALLNPDRIGNGAGAEFEGVGRARGPLLRGAAILLR